MKNKIYKRLSFLPLFILALCYSCDEDVTDLQPIDRVTEETAYDTKARCELSVVGAYDAAQSGYYPGNDARRGYPFGAASIIQSEMRSEDMVNNQAFFDFTYATTYNLVTANNSAMWENSFACINRLNVVKEGIEGAKTKGILTEAEANQYVGEVLFLRALTYHNLLIHFARPYAHTADASHPGLPLFLKGITTPAQVEEAKTVGRSSVADCYKQILSDLDYAQANLYVKNSVNTITRASKGAAIALKMRVYLHMGKWNEVLTEGNKLLPTVSPYVSLIGGYKLETSPETPFASFTSNSESMFSIENSSDDNATVNGSLSQMLSTRTGGRALVSISPILYNAKFFKADDKRRELLFMKGSDNVWYIDKYRNTTSMNDYAPILRYAEVLLNYAEAEARLNGNSETALSLLNAVRERSTSVYPAFPSAKELLQAILNERRVEFAGEGRRWEDIHRLALDPDFSTGGIPAKANYNRIAAQLSAGNEVFVPESGIVSPEVMRYGAFPYSDYRFLWPIPLSETSINQTLLDQQNEGWK